MGRPTTRGYYYLDLIGHGKDLKGWKVNISGGMFVRTSEPRKLTTSPAVAAQKRLIGKLTPKAIVTFDKPVTTIEDSIMAPTVTAVVTSQQQAAQQGPTMTSLELVAFINEERKRLDKDRGIWTELQHSDFLKKVPLVLGEGVAGKFSCYYVASNGKRQPMYRFPKRESCLMAMSYSYELQARVFDHMTALEAKLAEVSQVPALPRTFAEALRLAAEQAETIERQKEVLAIAAPKAEAYTELVADRRTHRSPWCKHW